MEDPEDVLDGMTRGELEAIVLAVIRREVPNYERRIHTIEEAVIRRCSAVENEVARLRAGDVLR